MLGDRKYDAWHDLGEVQLDTIALQLAQRTVRPQRDNMPLCNCKRLLEGTVHMVHSGALSRVAQGGQF